MQAIITGASGGIGSEAAIKLAENGYNISLLVNKNKAVAENILKKYSGDLFVCDFSNLKNVETIAKKYKEKHKKTDLLVNCAGISQVGLFTDFSSSDLEKIFNINIMSMMVLTREILPQMIHEKSGNIINITSMWGEVGASCEVNYSATKSAVIGFTKALAKEVGMSGIRVNCISPGVIDTKMMASFSESDKAELTDETPLQRLGTPADIANAVLFLANEKSSFITGEILRVNGGFII